MLSRAALEGVFVGITAALGSLLHFTYEWSGRSPGVAWFSATDESVNAHLSLVNVPFLACTLALLFLRKGEDVWFSRALGFLVTLVLIPLIYYSYTVGATRKSILAVDISTFVIAIAVGGLVSWLVARRWSEPSLWKVIVGALIHIAVFTWFVVTAYVTPNRTREPFVVHKKK